MFFPTFSEDSWIGRSFIGKEINLSKESICSSEEKPLDLRITNYVIDIFGSITSLALVSSPFLLLTHSMSVVMSVVMIPLVSPFASIEELAEGAANMAILSQLVQGVSLVGIVAGAIFASSLIYRHYMRPEFYPSNYTIERSLQNTLDEQKPAPPQLCFGKRCGPIRDSPVILCNEIFCRSLLLTARSLKTFYSAMHFAASPISLLTETVSSPTPAWKRFCKEARLLAAEIFEFIGVIVCSVLLLPLNRDKSRILDVQAWIEKKAEWISGEKMFVDSLQDIRDSAKAKKDLLLQARNVIGIDQEEIDNWVGKAVKFDNIIWKIDFILGRRRIFGRNYESMPAPSAQQKLDDKLTEIASIISDRIATIAIPRQKERLTHLTNLYHHPKHELIRSSCTTSDTLEKKLSIFQQLESEINKMVDQLHKRDDPDNVIGKGIESLHQQLRQAIDGATNDYSFQGGALDHFKKVNNHFFLTMKKFGEILYIYSYKNDEVSKTFISDLTKQIAECQKLLKNQCLTWATNSDIPLNRPKALEILDLAEPTTRTDIKKAYHRLSLIHHPDKGGQAEVFDTIHTAYEFLTKIKS